MKREKREYKGFCSANVARNATRASIWILLLSFMPTRWYGINLKLLMAPSAQCAKKPILLLALLASCAKKPPAREAYICIVNSFFLLPLAYRPGFIASQQFIEVALAFGGLYFFNLHRHYIFIARPVCLIKYPKWPWKMALQPGIIKHAG